MNVILFALAVAAWVVVASSAVWLLLSSAAKDICATRNWLAVFTVACVAGVVCSLFLPEAAISNLRFDEIELLLAACQNSTS